MSLPGRAWYICDSVRGNPCTKTMGVRQQRPQYVKVRELCNKAREIVKDFEIFRKKIKAGAYF